MVTHIVIFSWVEGTAQADVDRLALGLDRLAADMGDAVSIEHGPDLRLREGNGDYALVATFQDRTGWAAYQADARHKAFVRDFVSPIQASRVAIQF